MTCVRAGRFVLRVPALSLRLTIGTLILCAAAPLSRPLLGQLPRHPLDPLTAEEHRTILEVLRTAGRADSSTRYSYVTLQPPEKAAVLAWRPGALTPRAGFAILKHGPRTYEAVVDLANRRLLRWTEIRGGQPTWMEEEFTEGGEIALKDPRFRSALQRRGLDSTDVICLGVPPDTPASAAEEGRRVAQVMCFVAKDATSFPWGRGVGGLTAIVDVNEQRVLRFFDDGSVPVPTDGSRYDSAAVGRLRASLPPLRIEQPRGVGFRVDGQQVTWDNWSFHFRVDPRVGLVVSLAKYRDGDRWRSVLYEGSLSEMFVPYMDPSRPYYAFGFMDAGELSAGGLAKPLAEGIDCPTNASYFDAVVAATNGEPKPVPRAACIFERSTGDVAWRHQDFMTGTVESRVKRDLVLRMYATLGNYDYLFDWVFQQDGSIHVRVGATGIMMSKSVAQRVAGTATNGRTNGSAGAANGTLSERAPVAPVDAYGRFVAPNIVAVNHDHFLSFRLDLDVDGPRNSFLVDRIRTRRLAPGQPRRSLWTLEPLVARTESEAKLHMDMRQPAHWRIINTHELNHVGYPVSYQLVPEMNAMSLLSPDEHMQQRAGFTDYHVWVTPHRLDERYAAGLYVALSKPGVDGLPKWTLASRAIDDRDIVVWYTMGMRHVPRAEDWPVMPTVWNGFDLRPFDFFRRNPALDLPPLP